MTLPDWVSPAADLASLIGLVITVAVWFQTKAIRRSFALKGRLPEASATLKQISADLLKGLSNWPGSESDAYAAIARIDALLVNLLPKVGGPERGSLIKLRARLGHSGARWMFWHKQPERTFTKDEAWEIYYAVEGVVTSVEQIVKDTQWN